MEVFISPTLFSTENSRKDGELWPIKTNNARLRLDKVFESVCTATVKKCVIPNTWMYCDSPNGEQEYEEKLIIHCINMDINYPGQIFDISSTITIGSAQRLIINAGVNKLLELRNIINNTLMADLGNFVIITINAVPNYDTGSSAKICFFDKQNGQDPLVPWNATFTRIDIDFRAAPIVSKLLGWYSDDYFWNENDMLYYGCFPVFENYVIWDSIFISIEEFDTRDLFSLPISSSDNHILSVIPWGASPLSSQLFIGVEPQIERVLEFANPISIATLTPQFYFRHGYKFILCSFHGYDYSLILKIETRLNIQTSLTNQNHFY